MRQVSKHRVFLWAPAGVLPDKNLQVVPRADDATFGVLQGRFHEIWSLHLCSWMGKGNDPRYTPTSCFETFPFPAGFTPADTAHQQIEVLPGGASVPMGLTRSVRPLACAVATAAHVLTGLRDQWLNPPEWCERTPEVSPVGSKSSPYPDRFLAKPGFEKELAKRTLTNLYNERPSWLVQVHEALDAAVASAYGWTDYTPSMSDNEILSRLLALNLERARHQTGQRDLPLVGLVSKNDRGIAGAKAAASRQRKRAA